MTFDTNRNHDLIHNKRNDVIKMIKNEIIDIVRNMSNDDARAIIKCAYDNAINAHNEYAQMFFDVRFYDDDVDEFNMTHDVVTLCTRALIAQYDYKNTFVLMLNCYVDAMIEFMNKYDDDFVEIEFNDASNVIEFFDSQFDESCTYADDAIALFDARIINN